MPKVTGVMLDPTGAPVPAATVTAVLVGSRSNSTDTSTMDVRSHTRTGVDGKWSMELPANDALSPAGTHYQIVGVPPPSRLPEPFPYVFNIRVPIGPGPYQLEALGDSSTKAGKPSGEGSDSRVPRLARRGLLAITLAGIPLSLEAGPAAAAPPRWGATGSGASSTGLVSSTSGALASPGPGFGYGVIRRPQWQAALWSQQFQPGHGWTTSNVASSNLNDTSTFVRGTQSATLTTVGNNSGSDIQKASIGTTLDMTGRMIRLIFKVDDITNLENVYFFLSSGGFANSFIWDVVLDGNAGGVVQSGEWVTVHLQWADVAEVTGQYTIGADGTPSTKTGFTDMRFRVRDQGTGRVTAHLQAIEVIPDTTATFPSGVISMTFDDNHSSIWSLARPVMDAHGYRGTVYTIADLVGTSDYITLDQLRALEKWSGWEVAGHANTVADHSAGYNDLTSQQVNSDMQGLKSWLMSNGFISDSLAYPGGHFENTIDGVPVDQIASEYWSTGRTIIGSPLTESFPPAMPYRLRAITGISAAGYPVSTLTAPGGPLDRCRQSGSWLILSFHNFIVGTAPNDLWLAQDQFGTLLNAISAHGIPVLPIGDVMRN